MAQTKGIEGAENEDYSDIAPNPPDTVRNRAHLDELLRAGIASPKEEVTDAEWTELRREVRDRLARGKR